MITTQHVKSVHSSPPNININMRKSVQSPPTQHPTCGRFALFNHNHHDKHLHLHFKHITHRRIGTRNKFPDSSTDKCRLCCGHREESYHLAWCPATKMIFETIDALTYQTYAYPREVACTESER
eukprot:scaffold32418_cov36-Tisochrysis_lutea.AAC.4